MAKLPSTQTCSEIRASPLKGAVLQTPLIRYEGSKATSADRFHGLRERLIPPPYPFPLANKGCGTGWSSGTSRSGQRKSFNGWPASELFEARDADSRGGSPRSRRAELCPANAACQTERARSIAGRSVRTNWRRQPGKVLALVST
jgi:hypothetical protein